MIRVTHPISFCGKTTFAWSDSLFKYFFFAEDQTKLLAIGEAFAQQSTAIS